MKSPSDHIEADLKLIDRYKDFASELLKLSLLAIATLGFFFDKLATADYFSVGDRRFLLLYMASGALAFLGSGATAMLHRLLALGGTSLFIRAIRRRQAGQQEGEAADKAQGRKLYKAASFLLALSAILAAVGACIFVVSLFAAVEHYTPKS